MAVKAEDRLPMHGSRPRTEVHSRALNRTLRVRDARAEVARSSRRSQGERDEVRAFLESKREMSLKLRTERN
jgi:hypothetical protein